jgi:hypothetical protein
MRVLAALHEGWVCSVSELPAEKLAGDLTLQPGETSLVRKLFQSAWWCWLNECQRQADRLRNERLVGGLVNSSHACAKEHVP